MNIDGNPDFPVGTGGFSATFTEPTPANFQGSSGWWNVPQTWFTMVDRNGQIFASPNPFPNTPTLPAPQIAGTASVHFIPGPPVTNVTFNASAPHGLRVGDVVTITGAAHAFLNGTFSVSVVLSNVAFRYQIPNLQSGTYTDACVMQGPDLVNLNPTALTQPAPILVVALDLPLGLGPTSTVIATTTVPHGFPVGDATYYVPNPTPVTIAGASHAYLNGAFFITSVTDATHFTYSVAQTGTDEIFDSGTMQGAPTVLSLPSPRYSCKTNVIGDGALVFFDCGRNTFAQRGVTMRG